MSKGTKVPTVKSKKVKWYKIVTKPTTDAFGRGKRVTAKTVDENWLPVALLAAKNDPDVERFWYEEIDTTQTL